METGDGKSPAPFCAYPGGGHELLGRVRGENCRHGYGLLHQRTTGQNACAYCGMSLVDTFEGWLMMTYDHVAPASVCQDLGINVEWMDDMSNRVLSCSACNGFTNRWKPNKQTARPETPQEFFALRDRVFLERKEAVEARRAKERMFFESRPWKQRPEGSLA